VTSAGAGAPQTSAAFFDVDGTLVKSTIVHYYVFFRRRRLGKIMGRLWYACFLLKCLYFLVIDKINRSRFNVIFYRSYRGLPVSEIKAAAGECYEKMLKPKLFTQAFGCIAAHRHAGRRIVLVTGSIDFIMQPLAEALGVDDVIAPALLDDGARFKGELDGRPVGQAEKARRMRAYASAHGIDLASSYAYGDSMADAPMLDAVGHGQAVNPSKALAMLAVSRGWPAHRWTMKQ